MFKQASNDSNFKSSLFSEELIPLSPWTPEKATSIWKMHRAYVSIITSDYIS